jgi:hypothetical protein
MPLDTIYISIPEWEGALAELSTLGDLRMDPSLLPAAVIDRYRSEDFLTAGIFEGSYRDLLRVFAKRELRQKLLPWLNRHDDRFSILQSAVLATVDLARATTTTPDEATLVQDIISLASSDYAVPADATELQRVAMELAHCVVSIPAGVYPSLTGPSWVAREELARLATTAICSPPNADFVLDRQAVFRLPVS